MTAEQINKALQIVKLKGQTFIVPGGFVRPTGYALHHPERGFLSFKGDSYSPYTPIGGRKALRSIMDAGGLLNFDDVMWLQKGVEPT